MIDKNFLDKYVFVILGGFGVDFSSDAAAVQDGLNRVAHNILSHGVTSFCPTVITSSPDTYKEVRIDIFNYLIGMEVFIIYLLHLMTGNELPVYLSLCIIKFGNRISVFSWLMWCFCS